MKSKQISEKCTFFKSLRKFWCAKHFKLNRNSMKHALMNSKFHQMSENGGPSGAYAECWTWRSTMWNFYCIFFNAITQAYVLLAVHLIICPSEIRKIMFFGFCKFRIILTWIGKCNICKSSNNYQISAYQSIKIASFCIF